MELSDSRFKFFRRKENGTDKEKEKWNLEEVIELFRTSVSRVCRSVRPGLKYFYDNSGFENW